MKSNLDYIRKKMDEIQFGLLRFKENDSQVSLHVRAKSNEDNSINCLVDGDADISKLADRYVSLVQKCEGDYLYIAGRVEQKHNKNKKMLLIKILKACWFVRRSKGTLSWLQEKHIYNLIPDDELELAS